MQGAPRHQNDAKENWNNRKAAGLVLQHEEAMVNTYRGSWETLDQQCETIVLLHYSGLFHVMPQKHQQGLTWNQRYTTSLTLFPCGETALTERGPPFFLLFILFCWHRSHKTVSLAACWSVRAPTWLHNLIQPFRIFSGKKNFLSFFFLPHCQNIQWSLEIFENST